MEIRCYNDPKKLIGFLLLTVVMVGASYFCTILSDDAVTTIFGWAGVVFFGLGFIVFPLRFVNRNPQVILTDDGIEDCRLGLGRFDWAEISEISFGSVKSQKFLCVHLRDEKKYSSRLPKWKQLVGKANRAIGFSFFTIGFQGLTPGLKEILPHIEQAFAQRIK